MSQEEGISIFSNVKKKDIITLKPFLLSTSSFNVSMFTVSQIWASEKMRREGHDDYTDKKGPNDAWIK